MRFGSVEFFKVLIKTVLAIVFFVPLILAVVFGVLFVQKNARVNALQEENSAVVQENDKLSVMADILIGQKIGGVQDIREIISRSGASYDELITLAVSQKDIDAQGLYEILSKSGVSDKDIIAMAAAENTVNADEFYDVMSKNGITDKELVKAVLKGSGSGTEDFYNILAECGMTDSEIIDFINKKNGSPSKPNDTSKPENSDTSNTSDTSDTSDTSSGSSGASEPVSAPNEPKPYEALYPDMYVTAPQEYNYEEGTIYFTFDDGPSQYTYSILQYLKKYDVKATWFVVPDRSEWCAGALRSIANDGHTIGVHSASHDYEKIYASVEAFLEDFHEAWDIVREATGQTPQVFRFPGGSKNDFNVDTRDDIIKEMTRRGFRFYDWNVESGDVDGATWSDMYYSIPSDCDNLLRPVVLMHDTKQTTAYVIEDVLKVLVKKYKFSSIQNDTEPVQFIGPFS